MAKVPRKDKASLHAEITKLRQQMKTFNEALSTLDNYLQENDGDESASNAMCSLCREMDQRIRLLQLDQDEQYLVPP